MTLSPLSTGPTLSTEVVGSTLPKKNDEKIASDQELKQMLLLPTTSNTFYVISLGLVA